MVPISCFNDFYSKSDECFLNGVIFLTPLTVIVDWLYINVYHLNAWYWDWPNCQKRDTSQWSGCRDNRGDVQSWLSFSPRSVSRGDFARYWLARYRNCIENTKIVRSFITELAGFWNWLSQKTDPGESLNLWTNSPKFTSREVFTSDESEGHWSWW